MAVPLAPPLRDWMYSVGSRGLRVGAPDGLTEVEAGGQIPVLHAPLGFLGVG